MANLIPSLQWYYLGLKFKTQNDKLYFRVILPNQSHYFFSFFFQLLEHIKKVDHNEKIELGIVNPGLIKFGSRKYYRYIGSLTVPPCTEGIIWTIIKKVFSINIYRIFFNNIFDNLFLFLLILHCLFAGSNGFERASSSIEGSC